MSIRLSWPHLTWRKASWPSRTYHAKTNGHTYTVDHDGTSWTLRAWRDGTPIAIAPHAASTAKAMQQAADDHAARQSGGAA